MLILNQVSKSYKSETVLKEINLEFGNGLCALLAPNGAGKTTLIKMMATLLTPSSGNILYNGMDILKMGDRYRSEIGYLPQRVGYYANYTPRQFLSYIGALKDIERRKLDAEIERLLKLLGLDPVSDKKMRKFSGGMIQRIGIASAILGNPKIILLDEPTAGLDPTERIRLKNIISELSNDRIVILSTHITADIDFIANSIVMLKNQTALCQSSAERVRAAYNEHVFETSMPQSAAQRFRLQYLVLSEQYDGDCVRFRFYHPGARQAEWSPEKPNLEDVFLITYRENAPDKKSEG